MYYVYIWFGVIPENMVKLFMLNKALMNALFFPKWFHNCQVTSTIGMQCIHRAKGNLAELVQSGHPLLLNNTFINFA